LWDRLGPTLRQYLDGNDRGRIPETPKPGDAVFDNVESTIVATNRMALEAAAKRASDTGLAPEIIGEPLTGEAAIAGARLAEMLAATRRAGAPRCMILGGETRVTFRDGIARAGGRCQELALAAARGLQGVSPGVALLAAGTDGRDGPTDAAGAIVDGATWRCIAAAGRDPQRDLDAHDSYAALEAANALLKTGPTGTNVMDIVIGIS
jgi:glycerate-2-kinase